MDPPSLSDELQLSLRELSFGVRLSEVLSKGPVAGGAGAPPMAKIAMSDGVELIVQICDPVTQAPNPTRHETLDNLLAKSNATYASLRHDMLMEKLLAVAAEQSSRDGELNGGTDE